MPLSRPLRLLAASLVLALSAPAFATGTPAPQPDPAAPGEVLVGLQPWARRRQALAALTADLGAPIGYNADLGVFRLALPPGASRADAIRRLRARPGVRFAEPDYIRYACADPNDPYYATRQYGPQRIQADLSWDIWAPVQQVVVAIIDTGVDTTHPDLVNVLDRDANGDIVEWNTLTDTANALDDFYHGTHVAGIAGAQIDNGIGIAGIAGFNPSVPSFDSYVKLMPVKVLNSSGFGTDADVASGITWAVDHGAQIISMSLGGSSSSTTLSSAVAYAWSHNCVVVAAAGNSASSAPFYPAAYPNVLSVAATDQADDLTNFSQYGSWVLLAAPGAGIFSTLPTYVTHANKTLNYGSGSGTSEAAPHVAGEAAAIIAQNPGLTNADVDAIIQATTDTYTPYIGRTLAPAAGRINVFHAVQAAGTGSQSITAVSVEPVAALGGSQITGYAFLGAHAASPVTVSLSTDRPDLLAVPAGVTIPQGALLQSFPVQSSPVTLPTTAHISAQQGSLTATTAVTLQPLQPVRIVAAGPLYEGATITLYFQLNAPAPPDGAQLNLASANQAVAPLPPTLDVPGGATYQSAAVTLGTTLKPVKVNISASLNGQSASTQLLVSPDGASSLSASPSSVVGGQAATISGKLDSPAPAGGITLQVAANSASVQPPASITVSQGVKAFSFTVNTTPVGANTIATITVSRGTVKKTVKLTIEP